MTCKRCGSQTTTGGRHCAACRQQEHLDGQGDSPDYGWALDEKEEEDDETELVKTCPECGSQRLTPRQSTEHDYYCETCQQPVFDPEERERNNMDNWSAEAVLKHALDKKEVSN